MESELFMRTAFSGLLSGTWRLALNVSFSSFPLVGAELGSCL